VDRADLRASRAAATESPVRQRRAQLGREQPDAVPGEHSSADTFSGYGIYLEHSMLEAARREPLFGSHFGARVQEPFPPI
jgi:hypothetical protein